ncbi:hypothetical protein PV08_02295 [Exophiala spinifera]|uniref:FAD dependent oxidoreductase domain-containing protein n=1 Tax=Exophiala spinifera TaxID=91928 RepID=A0A0D2BGC8_9EURO|nr:uncharacterized protein PV08_02295 [Exophiala spinifera]KIW18008.1 hypothetical protein PV08_02295 [Exophiala spinifera]
MKPLQLPVPNPIPSVWTAQPHALDNHGSKATLPTECDIVIIGSGFSGVATAYHILKCYNNEPSIVLLEARELCSGATGRNGGHIKPDTYYSTTKYETLYGAQQASALQKFESSQVLAVKQLVETEALDCDFHLTRAVDVYLDRDHARKTYEAYLKLRQSGSYDLRDVAYTGKEDAERISGVKGAQCCFSFTAAHLWPKRLVLGLLERLLRRPNFQAHAHTPAYRVSKTQDEAGFWTISTSRGDLKARKIIYATNGYTASLLPQYRRKIVPVRGVCSHIKTSKGANSPHLPNTYSLRFGGANYDYLIPRADGSIVVGGARQTFLHDRDLWFDSVRDDERMSRASDNYFQGYMQRHFRGWEDSEASTDRVWTGVMGYTSDFMPHIGPVPDIPGQYVIAGFSGRGMAYILLASRALARMVVEGIDYEQTGLPTMFKSTRERLSASESELEKEFKGVWGSDQTTMQEDKRVPPLLQARL